ncbi:VWA domain-containing protein [Ruegeria sp. 2205SS24-7]|uniref:vWA domain-containing protein n=1 Tax=Ruegeria discodermiae TaxID=3064389 RepID=UPI0027405362|nr:VWA domain-containing protein [Ruegeria sp. 2205SS24-7]MDP5218893.1 VWA domain-containing protein [Ruegeria sp. 2205SS24-7]
MTLPQATYPFVEFPAILRQHGFAVAPDQTIGFIEAVGLLGPRGISDIHAAGLAMLAIPRERMAEYDALFRAYFLGQAVSAPASGEDDEVLAYESEGGTQEIDVPEDDGDVGGNAVATERLFQRQFNEQDEDAVLLGFVRQAPHRLPRRRSYRWTPSRHGNRLNMRQTLREAVRRDGEVFTLPQTRRKTRQRRIVLLIDVSGSMQDRTDTTLRFAHTLAQSADRFEAFTLGTRLTRITPALKLSQQSEALARISRIVADFDGGTRLGDAFEAYLSVPRFAGFARGATVIVLSDGLERGAPDAMIRAVQKLSRLAWRLEWLSPLANDPNYEPRTEALQAVLPWLDGFGDGAGLSAITSHVLNLEATP